MGTSHVTLDEAAILTVGEVMISKPKTLPLTATVADARRMFESPSVRTALVVDDGRYAGELTRADVDGADDAAAVAAWRPKPPAPPRRTTPSPPRSSGWTPPAPTASPWSIRTATLRGLVCLSRSRGQLCTDPR